MSNSNLNLAAASLEDLLYEVSLRTGSPVAQLGIAGLLYLKKSADYNSDSKHYALSNYFPFGTASYAQMIHTKSMRILSVAEKELNQKTANFESLQDSALDMINYAMFLADHCDKTVVGGTTTTHQHNQ